MELCVKIPTSCLPAPHFLLPALLAALLAALLVALLAALLATTLPIVLLLFLLLKFSCAAPCCFCPLLPIAQAAATTP